jgi:hypothetical protein
MVAGPSTDRVQPAGAMKGLPATVVFGVSSAIVSGAGRSGGGVAAAGAGSTAVAAGGALAVGAGRRGGARCQEEHSSQASRHGAERTPDQGQLKS